MLNFGNKPKSTNNGGNQDRPLIDNGTYVAKITRAEITPFKGEYQINVTFQIQGGKFDKRLVFYHIKKDQNDPSKFDEFGIRKVICYGQGWNPDNQELCDKLTKHGVRVGFEDYDDLVQYLSSANIVMKITTVNEADKNTGKFYQNPKISNFAPLSAETAVSTPKSNNSQGMVDSFQNSVSKATKGATPVAVSSDDDDLPF